jgi:hypothetical protein
MMSAETREAIRVRLEMLASVNDGRLTPEAVVEDAKNKDSPLHAHFTWDVKKAAQAYWIEQARTLITSVRVEMRTDETVVTSVAYVRDPSATGKQQGYVSVEALRTDKDLARDALVSEFGRVGDMLRRARELAAALDVEKEVDKLLSDVVGLRQRVMEPSARRQ